MNEYLIKIQNDCISKNIPFVTFRFPRQENSTTYIQTSSEFNHWNSIKDISSETGFIMAPFDISNGVSYIEVKPDLLIESDQITREQIEIVEGLASRPQSALTSESPVVTEKDAYMEQVETIKGSISTGTFQKAVLSRIEVIEGEHISVIPEIYQTLCDKHPNSFVYLFKRDEHFWMGASPEPLMRLRDGIASTVSLAGTRPFAKKHQDVNKWTLKEVLEQEYVTRYIHDVLRDFGIRDYRVSSPYVKKAGNLAHLCTDFSFGFDTSNGQLWNFVDAMHPTPAVAGQPKDDAIRFIKQFEPHKRDYYTGFLGPVNRNDCTDLFVNLRCLKICSKYLLLYIGGGITLDSDPEEEWDETCLKRDGLLNIIQSHIQ